MTRFRVVVQYPADGFEVEVDERITSCVAREPDFTGCGFVGNATRDIGWYCRNRAEADSMVADIKDGYWGWPPIECRVEEQADDRQAGEEPMEGAGGYGTI